MSAWIVSRSHIDVLVSALVASELVPASEADKVGRILWAENHKSVNALYAEKARAPRYAHSEYHVDAATVVMSAKCFAYQSCEHRGWPLSAACAWMTALRLKFNEAGLSRAALDAAPWGIDDARPSRDAETILAVALAADFATA